jgi:DNA-binding MarR family transcriptional regulator
MGVRSGKMVFVETKRDVIASIGDLTGRIAARFAEEDADEQTHMRAMCSPGTQRVLDELSVEMLHLLDAIPVGNASDESVNVVSLSQATGTPKGTVSKRLQRLTDAGAISRFRIPGNRKEIHLRLTPIGEEIRAAHRSLHEQMGEVLDEFLARYSAAELAALHRILNDLLRMPRDGVRFRPDLLD